MWLVRYVGWCLPLLLRRLVSSCDGSVVTGLFVPLGVVMGLSGAALLAAPGVFSQARAAGCETEAESLTVAITASYATHRSYARTGGAALVSDGFLRAAPVGSDFSIEGPRAGGVAVVVGPDCGGSHLPVLTWGEPGSYGSGKPFRETGQGTGVYAYYFVTNG